MLPDKIPPTTVTELEQDLRLEACPLASTTPAKNTTYVVKQLVLSGWGEIDTRLLIIVFHLLSFLFQAITSWNKNYYSDIDKGNTNLSHFVEYSISASILLIAMCAQLGITDFYLILSIAANCWGCMIFGFIAELLYQEDVCLIINMNFSTPKYPYDKEKMAKNDFQFSAHWMAHLAGWFLIIIALIGTTSNLITMENCISPDKDIKMPGWVKSLIGAEVGLYCLFGFVQTASFVARQYAENDVEAKKRYAIYTELAYIVLSLTAKLFLGIIVISNNWTNSN